MIYFLTTTLVLPTFTTSIAHAEDTNEDKMKSSSTQEEQTNHNEDVNDNNIMKHLNQTILSPITHLLKHLLRKIRRTR